MYRGSGTDHPLSALGWEQMKKRVTNHPDSGKWSCIVSSPMQRCRAFAEKLAKEQGIALEIVENFKEAGYGVWEGKTPAQLKQEFARAYWDFYADPVNNRPAGAEPLNTFVERIEKALEGILERHQGQHILLVSHSGVMRAIVGITLNMPLASQQQINIPYAGMLYLLEEKRGRRIGFY